MTAKADPIGVVEAAYAPLEGDAAWLSNVARAAQGYSVGGGVVAYTVEIANGARVVSMGASPDVNPDNVDAIRRATAAFPPHLAAEMYSPTEFVGNAAHRLQRLARERPVSAQARAQAAMAVPDLWALVAGDPLHGALVLAFPRGETRRVASPEDPFPLAESRALGRVGAHLGAALRLRALAAPVDQPPPDAVLTPSGKVLHASPRAAHARERASLVEAVVLSQRARGNLRRANPDEALQGWTALVAGQWTIVEAVERDGRRLVLARRNPLGRPDVLGLTAPEGDAVWLAAMGHSNKYIAYELGVPLATVAGRLRRAMRKLRVATRGELLTRLGAVANAPHTK